VVDLVLPVAAFALGWPLLSRVSGIVSGGVMAGMVLAHLTLILPLRRKALTSAAVALFVTGVSLLMIRSYQVNDRLFGELYVTTLAPPALRVVSPVTATRFIEESRDLKAILDAHVEDEDNGDAWGEAFDASID
jgi:hypothetical protein